ncbi:DNA cytosine methyltransferase [Shewanella baltica]|uniref:DNA cytosine methyltransferase n=1 Tax=Shewanella baltica TaxID=62322 RepID=UPI00217DBA58|nr:DNA cytosine methyltransferase [Shewanella baltica]MCS6177752.1 DNA cytosine methyltransferase [Shewanella baltica]MCS6253898.1 DNA cytosine methyltransferase [Shewanella baltica]
MSNSLNIVDLFCGCGGFGLGAELAGFKSIAAVDVDETLQSAYKLNFPHTRVIKGDLSTMDENSWRLIVQNSVVDGVIGGPPCQGYSRMGKREQTDPRNQLLHHYFRHITILNPKFFVMENVEGLLDECYKDVLNDAINIVSDKYTIIGPKVVDATDYGAATKRKRVIIFGYDPLRVNAVSAEELFDNSECRSTTVKDAIFDLAEPISQSKDKKDFGWGEYNGKRSLSEYALKMRSLPPKDVGSTEAIRRLKAKMLSGFFDTQHTPEVTKRYEALQPEEVDSISRSKKLSWSGVCPTLRAGTGADKGSYQAVRPIHPTSARVITVREAARLQGFPDWFCFHPTKWHSFRMIGNSVSPIVSEKLMINIKNLILNVRQEQNVL